MSNIPKTTKPRSRHGNSCPEGWLHAGAKVPIRLTVRQEQYCREAIDIHRFCYNLAVRTHRFCRRNRLPWPSWQDISKAFNAGKREDYLFVTQVSAIDDGHGTDKEAMMVTANPVIAASADACLEPLGMLPHTVSGAWASDCDSEGQANNYARYYTFTLSEETRVAIYLTSTRDTYLYLRQWEGKTCRSLHDNNNVGRGNINSRIEETLADGDLHRRGYDLLPQGSHRRLHPGHTASNLCAAIGNPDGNVHHSRRLER